MPPQPAKLIYFYAKEDQNLVNQVILSLALLRKKGLLEIWSPQSEILGGGEERLELIEAVRTAQIVLYFFSDNFIASKCYEGLEATRANVEQIEEIEPGVSIKEWILRKHGAGQLLIIPILLYNLAGFDLLDESNLAVLPEHKPLGNYEKADRMNKCCEIAKTISQHLLTKEESVTKPTVPIRSIKIPALKPSFLPQLCARNEQNRELKQVFENPNNINIQSPTKRPFVSVIHGLVDECPEGFKARLEKREIYELLEIDYETPIKIYDLGFPYDIHDIQEPKAFFDRTLKETFYESRDYDPADNPGLFLNQFQTVLINYDVFSENWSKYVMESFFDFWNKILLQNNRTTIIVNLFFSYDENSEFNKRTNQSARDFFIQLKQTTFVNYPNINIAVTSELDAIRKTEVTNWLYNKKVFLDFCSQHSPEFCDKSIVQTKVNDLYSEETTLRRFTREIKINDEVMEITLIRMKTLSKELGEFITKNRCR